MRVAASKPKDFTHIYPTLPNSHEGEHRGRKQPRKSEDLEGAILRRKPSLSLGTAEERPRRNFYCPEINFIPSPMMSVLSCSSCQNSKDLMLEIAVWRMELQKKAHFINFFSIGTLEFWLKQISVHKELWIGNNFIYLSSVFSLNLVIISKF